MSAPTTYITVPESEWLNLQERLQSIERICMSFAKIQQQPLPPMLTVKQAAEFIGVSEKRIRTMVHEGVFLAAQFGERATIRIPREEVLKYLLHTKREAA